MAKGIQIPEDVHAQLTAIQHRTQRTYGVLLTRAVNLLDRDTADENVAADDEWTRA